MVDELGILVDGMRRQVLRGIVMTGGFLSMKWWDVRGSLRNPTGRVAGGLNLTRQPRAIHKPLLWLASRSPRLPSQLS